MEYYKFVNGINVSNYEIEDSLMRIEKILLRSGNNLVSGIFSAIIATQINYNTADDRTNILVFIVAMITLYFLISGVLNVLKFIFKIVKLTLCRNKVGDDEEIRLSKIVHERVINEIVYAISLVNKVKGLKTELDKGQQTNKKELVDAYLMQAMYRLDVAYNIMNNEFGIKTKRQKKLFIQAIGADTFEWIVNTASNEIKEITELNLHIESGRREKMWLDLVGNH